jgi:hypothetical protein
VSVDIDDLTPDALTWPGVDPAVTIGAVGAELSFDEGVEGLDIPSIDRTSTPAGRGGTWGGRHRYGPRLVSCDAVLTDELATAGEFEPLWRLAEAMQVIESPAGELPLYWRGLMWPGAHCVFARPVRCEWLTDEDGVKSEVPGFDLAWEATDPTAYSAAQAAEIIDTEDPQSSVTFEVANAGGYRPAARRAWEFRMTAHGTVTSPRIRVDHADGSWEQVELSGLTMTGGQVLTLGPDRVFRVQSILRTGNVRSTTSSWVPGATSRALRMWRLLHSTGSDGNNEVTMSVASGAFSGFCKTRSTW